MGMKLDIKRVLASSPKKPDGAPLLPLTTEWGERIDPEHVLPEHPRPQFARADVTLLNGWWEWGFGPASDAVWTAVDPGRDGVFDGRILVPFSPEAPLSGVGRQLKPGEALWYRRRIEVTERPGWRWLLHFDAVDWACACWVNGVLVGTHEGGYEAFAFDVTDALTAGCGSDGPAAAGGFAGGEGVAGTDGSAGGDDIAGTENSAEAEGAVVAEVVLCVLDPSDAGVQPRGKQKLDRGGIWYTAQSGIWQPVWLESVPPARVESLVLDPDLAAGELRVRAEVAWEEFAVGDRDDALATPPALRVMVRDRESGRIFQGYALLPAPAVAVGTSDGSGEGRTLVDEDSGPVAEPLNACQPVAFRTATIDVRVFVPDPHPWSPDDPFLYDVVLRFGDDRVSSYCAFRTAEVRRDAEGRARFFLNGRPLFLRGVLDQGYWPDGLMTAPSDEALAFDIRAMKAAGFNMLRKHIKVERERWYYLCDKLGMLVWQDMVSGGGPWSLWQVSYKPTLFSGSWGRYDDTVAAHQRKLGAGEAAGCDRWRAGCLGTVAALRNHPCVVTWVLFNEGWGQFDAVRAAAEVSAADPTRPIDSVSGWYDQHCGDYLSVHNYFRPLEVMPDNERLLVGAAAERGCRAFAISEFGGLTLPVAEHVACASSYGYETFENADAWRRAVRDLLAQADALEAQGLAGYVYTQLSDVEEEVNGLLTYDRRVNKLEAEAAAPAGAGGAEAATGGGETAAPADAREAEAATGGGETAAPADAREAEAGAPTASDAGRDGEENR